MRINAASARSASLAPRTPGLAAIFFVTLVTRAACDPIFDAIKYQAGGGIGPGAAINMLMLAIALAFVLKQPRSITAAVLPMWLPFLFVSLVSMSVAPSFLSSARLFTVQLSYCAVFAIPFYLVRSVANVERSVLIVLWSSFVPVAAGLFQTITTIGAMDPNGIRINGTFSHPNIYGFYLVLVAATILYIQKSAIHTISSRRRRFLWIYMALILALLICTKTRSAWVGALLIFGIYGLIYERRYLIYVLVVPSIVLLDSGIRERLVELASSNETPIDGKVNSYTWRVLLWKAGANWMDSSHFSFGYGLDSFKFYSPRFFPLEGEDTWDPHNVYVQLFFETGIAGIVSYLWLFYCLFKKLAKAFYPDRKGAVIIISVALCYLVTSWTDNMLYYLSFNWYYWFLMGSVCAYFKRGSNDRD